MDGRTVEFTDASSSARFLRWRNNQQLQETRHVDNHHQRWRPHLLVAHGDDGQIVPIQAAALKAVTLLPNATLEVYPGAPPGLNGDYERELESAPVRRATPIDKVPIDDEWISVAASPISRPQQVKK
jgi:hypothetical protein